MKVLIFYAKYGGGHLSAANSINDYLNKNYPNVQTSIIDCMEYVNKAVSDLTTAAYKEMAKKYPWAWGFLYNESQKGYIAHISTRTNKLLAIKLLKLLEKEDPDLIVSTHPFGSQMCAYLKRKNKIHAKIATILTDFAPHDQWLVGNNETNYYFVANENIKNYIKSKKIKNPKVMVSGIPISEHFSDEIDKSKVFSELGLDENKQTILFFGGGEFGLGKNQTLEIFKNLISSKLDFQVIAISGKNKSLKQEMEDISYDKPNIKVLSYTQKVAELMTISDIVFTKPGGLTTSESLCKGLPMIVINPIPGQEEENAQFLVEQNIARWIKDPNDTLEITESLLTNQELLQTMSNNALKLAKPNATKDICDFLIQDNNL